MSRCRIRRTPGSRIGRPGPITAVFRRNLPTPRASAVGVRHAAVAGLLIAAGIAVLVLAIVKGADWGWGSAETLGGTGLLTMGRQIGSALGVAVLVPILGTPTGAASFDGAWLFMLASAGGAAIALAATGPAVGVAATRPTAATAEATA